MYTDCVYVCIHILYAYTYYAVYTHILRVYAYYTCMYTHMYIHVHIDTMYAYTHAYSPAFCNEAKKSPTPLLPPDFVPATFLLQIAYSTCALLPNVNGSTRAIRRWSLAGETSGNSSGSGSSRAGTSGAPRNFIPVVCRVSLPCRKGLSSTCACCSRSHRTRCASAPSFPS